jgi:hypothetical protein
MLMNSQAKERLPQYGEAHREDIEAISQTLAKITNRTPNEIKPHLDAMLSQLVEPQMERPFYETATVQEWVQALHSWSESHEQNTPLLSDYAVSREGIYEDEES